MTKWTLFPVALGSKALFRNLSPNAGLLLAVALVVILIGGTPRALAADGSTPAIRETRDGVFFTASPGSSRFELKVPVRSDVVYDTATIEFDAKAPSFPGAALHGIVDMVNPGKKGRYFAIQHTLLRVAEKGIRTNVDNLAGGTSVTRTDVLDAVHREGALLHYRVVYSIPKKAISIAISNRSTGQINTFTEDKTREGSALIEEDGIRDLGSGLVVGLGLVKVFDHGGYTPPYGWSFSNLSVEVTGGRASSAVAPASASSAKARMIVDADTANEIDDFFAITRALLAPELEIEGLTAAAFRPNTSTTPAVRQSQICNEEILSHLGLSGRVTALPGAEGSLVDIATPLDSPAARHIIARAHAGSASNKLWVIALGQCTTLASALLLDPTITEKVRFAFIDGDYKDGKWGPGIYNWKNDIVAVKVLFESGVEYFHMPARSVSGALKMNKADAQLRLQHQGGIRDYLWTRWEARQSEKPTWTMWDLALVEAILRPQLANSAAVGAPLIHAVNEVEQNPGNRRRVTVWTEIDVEGMCEDFWKTLAEIPKR